jgi:hypothetical protein
MKIYNIKHGIRNLWRWFPIIWKDRDWDQYYIFELLKFKFKNMEHNFRNYAHIADADKVADDLKVCQLLLKRLIEDDYYDNVYKWHDKKWGELEVDWDKSPIKFSRRYVNSKEEKEKEHKEYMRLYNREEMLRKQDIRYLFHIITRKITMWWD